MTDRLIRLIVLSSIVFSTAPGVNAERIEILPYESPPDGVTIPSSVSFRGIAVRNAKEAWATGSRGTAVRTLDGGKTFSKVKVALPKVAALDFRDVALLQDGSVLLMSAGEGEKSKVVRSEDGGKSWTAVLENKAPKGFFDGMSFDPSGRVGFLYGDPINGRLDLYGTTDGGKKWTPVPRDNSPTLKTGEYGFAASGTGIVVHKKSVWVATGGSTARVLYSPDLSQSWTATTVPVHSGNASSGIFSIGFRAPGSLIAIGGDYLKPTESSRNVALTTDGGKTWRKVPKVKMPHKACVQWLDNTRVMACGRTGVVYSDDAGASWRTVTTDSYYTLAVSPDGKSGYLAGNNARVARFRLRDK